MGIQRLPNSVSRHTERPHQFPLVRQLCAPTSYKKHLKIVNPSDGGKGPTSCWQASIDFHVGPKSPQWQTCQLKQWPSIHTLPELPDIEYRPPSRPIRVVNSNLFCQPKYARHSSDKDNFLSPFCELNDSIVHPIRLSSVITILSGQSAACTFRSSHCL